MEISRELNTDILVVGAGLAGISAAIQAAEKNRDVIVAVDAKFCSGSSFYPGTWGLGMVAPIDEEDKKDFVKSIDRVGSKIPDKRLSRILVNNIGKRINELERWGVKFKKPDNLKEDRSLIPCFDHKHRKWYGYTFKSARRVFNKKSEELNIDKIENLQIIKLIIQDNRFKAALGLDANNKLVIIYADAVILASGGFGNIFKHSLNTGDINGYGQVMALEAGCNLINIEFIQFIPGYLYPHYKTIFNERTFEYAVLTDKNDNRILPQYVPEKLDEDELLKERASHGPFTSRLKTKYVDIALFKDYLSNKDEKYMNLHYKDEIKNSNSLMIEEYFKWLKREKGLTYKDPIRIVPFQHAANGGIMIDQKASTNIEGIFAAGEVTGGMHGADRIGGLSTANGLVFGQIAGQESSLYSKNNEIKVDQDYIYYSIKNYLREFKYNNEDLDNKIEKLREIMWENASIIRSKDSLNNTMNQIEEIKDEIKRKVNKSQNKNIRQIRKKVKLNNYIKLSAALLNVMLERKESRGSHYREDYPEEKREFDLNFIIKEEKNGLKIKKREF